MPDLEALAAEAGWNQTHEDWERMLSLGTGRGVADETGRVVASSVTMPYGDAVGWIGMVLVTAAWRRCGLATRLLDRAVASLRDAGLVPGLDATPAGEPVYRRLGFSGDVALTRWRRPAAAGRGSGPAAPDDCTPDDATPDDATPDNATPDDARLAETTPGDLDWIAALDARAFGADRRPLLASLLARGAAGWKRGEAGFLLRRPGRTATQLGPLCAEDEGTAAHLLACAVQAEAGPLLIDVPDAQEATVRLLERAGFTAERPFLRMYLGAGRDEGVGGEPALLHAIAGPELG